MNEGLQIKQTLVGSVNTMRPTQWYKQVIVAVAVVFSGNLFNLTPLMNTIATIVAFSFVASGVYTMNDISDVEEDRKHPSKQHRPIASGRLSIKIAYLNTLLLCVAGMALGFIVHPAVFAILVIYIAQNVLYSHLFHSIPIADILIISIGFVLRAMAGVYAVNRDMSVPSRWLIICTFLAALLLALGKRYKEQDGEKPKEMVYNRYNLESFIDTTVAILALSYILYTVLDSQIAMMITIPSSLYAVFRYRILIEGASPTDSIGRLVLKDTPFVINLFVWTVLVVSILYFV